MRKFLILKLILLVFILNSCAQQGINSNTDYTSSVDGKYLYDMGVSYLSSGNNAMAISYLEKALEINKQPEVYNSLALAYQFAGEYEKALKTFKEGLERYPNSPGLLTNYGILLAVLKKYNEAITYLEKAVNHPTYPKKEIAFYNLGLIYRELGKEDKFIDYVNKAIMYNSNYLNAYLTLGDYYYERYKKYKNLLDLKISRDYYAKALQLSINDPIIFYKLGLVYKNLNQVDLAKFYLEKALKASQDNKNLQEEIKKVLLDLVKNPKREENLNPNNESKINDEADQIKNLIK
ncbi:tetratricopeptide repeat protein [Sulfurihydrogenibium azorense]|uniref:tetratricopeptide repeat protein n=1 Tax=Sulfurihydrogenibium azorense TaxID=309806 RepID=UPI002409FA2A|nr:tetratricopeptide repeat protein [Sulfurihydrogenibium azorense]MDM7274199.1 tetratricopeptide repeat protein [Sulfurihydrogenibium azorense]